MSDESTATPPRRTDTEVKRLYGQLHHRPAKPRYWLAALLLVLALGAGAAIGAAGTVIYFQRKNFPVRPGPEEISKSIIARMEELIQLTPEEAKSVEAVIRSTMLHVGEIRDESRDRIRDQFQDMGRDLREILGPERFKVWDDYRRQRMGERKDGRKRQDQEHDRSSEEKRR